MGFKIGDKVRAKSWEEIEKTLDSNGYCHGMYFNGKMKEYCGETFRLEDSYCYDAFYGPEDWLWAEEWLEPIESAKKKEKESVKMEKVVVVRGMNEQQIRKYLGTLAKSIETVEWLEPIESAKKKEKESVKMEKVVVVRGMNEQQIRKYLGTLAKSIETVEMPRSVWEICGDIFNKCENEEISYFLKGNTTVAVTKDGRVGVARLRVGDTYNINIGRALARARALHFKALEKELLAAL